MESSFDPLQHIKFIDHNGKQIFFVDYSHCKDKWEMIKLLEASADFYRRSDTKLLSLSDFHNIKGSSEFMDTAKRLNREVLDEWTEKGAVIGVAGLKKVLLQGYNLIASQKLIPFDTKEEALKYLAE
jgi:hypothetical protein